MSDGMEDESRLDPLHVKEKALELEGMLLRSQKAILEDHEAKAALLLEDACGLAGELTKEVDRL